ncbi:MAG: general secretion pathway protein GspB [Gammaproteobacteria bacterium]|nr:general secretion pathway protein GspB [Gammaproteobacteria bacterium]
MSYILDALRKSEQDRREAQSPSFGEMSSVAFVRPHQRLVVLAAIVIVVLGIAAIGAYAVWKPRPTTASSPAAVPAALATAAETLKIATDLQPAIVPTTPASVPVLEPGATAVGQNTAAPVNEVPPPALKPAPFVSATSSSDNTVRNLEEEARVELPKPAAVTANVQKPSARAAVPVTVNNAVSNNTASSAIKFLRAMPPDFQQSLPALVVNIHIYAPVESERILYINNHQYQAGDKVRDDIVIEKIVEDGAVLSYRGQRFKLPRPS